MSLFAYYDGTEVSGRIRLGQVTGLIQAAEKGTLSTSGISLDDPSANLTIVGLKTFNINEADASPVRLFSGFTADRDVDRFESGITGAARRWDITLNDLNYVFGQNIIDGSDGNRPEETDIARISWLRSAGYLPLSDNGLINTTGPVTLDEADYRGQYPLDVISECSEMSGKNFWAYNDDPSGQASLAYFLMTSATYASTLRLTNDAADVDSSTTFAARVRTFKRNPDRVYSKVYLPYVGGAVSVTRSSTQTAFGARGIAAPSVSVKTAARATTLANRFLDDASTEDDRITVEVQLPIAKVNDILPGHRIEAKFTHLPGYTSYTWTRVVRRTVKQSREDDTHYQVEYDLNIPKLVRFHGTPGNLTDAGVGGSPVSVDPNIANAIDDHCGCEPYANVLLHTYNEGYIDGIAQGTTTLDNAYSGAWVISSGSQVWQNGLGLGGAPLVGRDYKHLGIGSGSDPVGLHNHDRQFLSRAIDSTVGSARLTGYIQRTGDMGGVIGYEIIAGNWGVSNTGSPPAYDYTAGTVIDSGTVPTGLPGQPIDVIWSVAGRTHAQWLIKTTTDPTVNNETNILVFTDPAAPDLTWTLRTYGTRPLSGQEVNEDLGLGDGSTTLWRTLYPYQAGSLKVRVDGIDVTSDITETDPDNRQFTFGSAPQSDETVTVTYQGTGT